MNIKYSLRSFKRMNLQNRNINALLTEEAIYTLREQHFNISLILCCYLAHCVNKQQHPLNEKGKKDKKTNVCVSC